jgi:hypothetical protein
MIEVNVQQEGFLGFTKNPDTSGYLFRRDGPRDWKVYNHTIPVWEPVTDRNALDALEAGYSYGREYLRWQINQCCD